MLHLHVKSIKAVILRPEGDDVVSPLFELLEFSEFASRLADMDSKMLMRSILPFIVDCRVW